MVYYSRKKPIVKKTVKRTYKKKRFNKNVFRKGPQRTLRSGLYIPQQAYVKLPYTEYLQSPVIAANSNGWTFGFNGNGLCCPSTSASDVPTAGQRYPLGLEQYEGFYKYYKVLGASIKVQLNNAVTADTGATAVMRCVLIAAQGLNGDVDVLGNYRIAQLATTDDLINYPGASWRMMSSANGSQSTIWLKAFRKTKTLLGIKDVRDNTDCQGLLRGTDTNYPNGTNPYDPTKNNSGSWFYMIRVDPANAVELSAGRVQCSIKIKYYVQLYGRDFNVQGTVPA